MSSGKAHARASLLLSASGVPVALWTRDPLAGLVYAAGCASGVVLSPDLDVDHKTKSEEVVWRWGGALGFVYQVYWYPYALAFKHRSFWSHFPGISTALRALYAFWWMVPLSFAISWMPGPLARWYAAWWLVGLCLSDAAHWVMDGCPFRAKGRKERQVGELKKRRLVVVGALLLIALAVALLVVVGVTAQEPPEVARTPLPLVAQAGAGWAWSARGYAVNFPESARYDEVVATYRVLAGTVSGYAEPVEMHAYPVEPVVNGAKCKDVVPTAGFHGHVTYAGWYEDGDCDGAWSWHCLWWEPLPAELEGHTFELRVRLYPPRAIRFALADLTTGARVKEAFVPDMGQAVTSVSWLMTLGEYTVDGGDLVAEMWAPLVCKGGLCSSALRSGWLTEIAVAPRRGLNAELLEGAVKGYPCNGPAPIMYERLYLPLVMQGACSAAGTQFEVPFVPCHHGVLATWMSPLETSKER